MKCTHCDSDTIIECSNCRYPVCGNHSFHNKNSNTCLPCTESQLLTDIDGRLSEDKITQEDINQLYDIIRMIVKLKFEKN